MEMDDSFSEIVERGYGIPVIRSFDDMVQKWDFSESAILLVASADEPDVVASNLTPIIEILHCEGGIPLEDVYAWLQDEPLSGISEQAAAQDMEASCGIEYMVKYGDQGFAFLLNQAFKGIYGIS